MAEHGFEDVTTDTIFIVRERSAEERLYSEYCKKRRGRHGHADRLGTAVRSLQIVLEADVSGDIDKRAILLAPIPPDRKPKLRGSLPSFYSAWFRPDKADLRPDTETAGAGFRRQG